jgi:alcohol dehydrogenase class IV
MQFEFATARRILFGAGRIDDVPMLAAGMGENAFLIGGGDTERTDALLVDLKLQGIGSTRFTVAGEPTTDLIQEATAQARDQKCDLVIGMGGGSVIDAAKAVAALLTNEGDIFTYLEVIGQGQAISRDPAPCIAIPTTAGTGAEVTRNAVMVSPEHQVKVSMRSPLMLPRKAVVDPELTLSLPPALTASTGMDALTQLLEAFVSRGANPLTDGICREGMRRAARSLERACAHGDDLAAREDMAIASLFGGLALANAKLGAAHGLAAPLGGQYAIPHGVVCARLLPLVMEANIAALKRTGATADAALKRYTEVARLLLDDPRASAEEGAAWAHKLVDTLAIPGLAEFGFSTDDIPAVVPRGQRASSMQGNPVVLGADALAALLEKAI